MGVNAFGPRADEDRRPTPQPDKEEIRLLNATDLKDIYPHREAKAEVKQGKRLGNCYFALGLAAFRESKIFDRFLEECVRPLETEDANGNTRKGWRISFWGADFPVDVFADDLFKERQINRKDEIVTVGQIRSKNPIDQIIEVAYGRYLYRSEPETTHQDNQTFIALDQGGFSHHFLQVVLGDYYDYDDHYKTVIASQDPNASIMGRTIMFGRDLDTLGSTTAEEKQQIMSYLLEQYQNPQNMILTAGTPVEGKPYPKKKRWWNRDQKGEAEMEVDYMDPEQLFAAQHAYAIKVKKLDVKALQQGQFVKAARSLELAVINPWDTSIEHPIGWQKFMEYFRLLSPVHILKEPQVRTKERISDRLSAGQEAHYEDQGHPFFIGAPDQGIVMNWDVDHWALNNTVNGSTMNISPGPTGEQEVLFGRSVPVVNGQACLIFTPQTSRKHFTVVFRHGQFTVKAHGSNPTNIKGTTVDQEERERQAQEKAEKEARLKKEAQWLAELFKDRQHYPWQAYSDKGRSLEAKALPLTVTAEHLAFFGDKLREGIPLTAQFCKLYQLPNGEQLIIYNNQRELSWVIFDPRLQGVPPVKTDIIMDFLDDSTLSGGALETSISFPFPSQDLKAVFEEDVSDAMDRMEDPMGSWEVITRDNQRLVINKYGRGRYKWTPAKPFAFDQWDFNPFEENPLPPLIDPLEGLPPDFRYEIAERTRTFSPRAQQIAELCEPHQKNISSAVKSPALDIPWTLEEVIAQCPELEVPSSEESDWNIHPDDMRMKRFKVRDRNNRVFWLQIEFDDQRIGVSAWMDTEIQYTKSHLYTLIKSHGKTFSEAEKMKAIEPEEALFGLLDAAERIPLSAYTGRDPNRKQFLKLETKKGEQIMMYLELPENKIYIEGIEPTKLERSTPETRHSYLKALLSSSETQGFEEACQKNAHELPWSQPELFLSSVRSGASRGPYQKIKTLEGHTYVLGFTPSGEIGAIFTDDSGIHITESSHKEALFDEISTLINEFGETEEEADKITPFPLPWTLDQLIKAGLEEKGMPTMILNNPAYAHRCLKVITKDKKLIMLERLPNFTLIYQDWDDE